MNRVSRPRSGMRPLVLRRRLIRCGRRSRSRRRCHAFIAPPVLFEQLELCTRGDVVVPVGDFADDRAAEAGIGLVDQRLQLRRPVRQSLTLSLQLLAVVVIIDRGIDERSGQGTVTHIGASGQGDAAQNQRQHSDGPAGGNQTDHGSVHAALGNGTTLPLRKAAAGDGIEALPCTTRRTVERNGGLDYPISPWSEKTLSI